MNPLLGWLRLKRVWIPLVAIAVYGLFGFLALPGILRGQIVSGIRTNMKREARLDRVRVNPFFLSLTLEGFELRDPDGTPFVAFDRLHVDYQLSSLVRWAITLREFSVDRPRVHVRVMPNGEPNFADLVAEQDTTAPAEPPRLVIGRFAVQAGTVRLTNLMAQEPEDGKLEPIDLDLRNFTTIPDREGRYHITASDPGGGGWEWTGDLTFQPLHSEGTLDIRGSRLRRLGEIGRNRIPYEISDGQFGCRLNYAVAVKGESLVARVHDTSASLTGIVLRAKRGPELLQFDSLAVGGIDVRYPEQTVSIGRARVAGARVQTWLAPDSTVNWLALMDPPYVETPADSTALWNVTLAELVARNVSVAFTDSTNRPPFHVEIEPANLTLRNYNSRPGSRFDVESDLRIAEKGSLTASGTISADPPAADLEVKLADLPLDIFQPYLDPVAKLDLVSGTLGGSGTLAYVYREPIPDVRFRGQAESRGFLTRDKLVNDRFVSWKRIHVGGLDFTTERLRIGNVRLTEPYAKLIVARDRTTNVQDILGLRPTPAESAAAAQAALAAKKKKSRKRGAPVAHAAAPAPAAPAFPVRVGTVEFINASSDFADFSLILPFAARIEQLGGTIQGLSSDSATRARVELDGAVQPSGTAQVRGEINPLAEKPFMDLDVVFRGFNMPVLTPYTGQFIGREVDKGSMALDLNYVLDGRHLKGKNKIVLDQFELGNKVESPEATKLPVGLAIAILKDKNGQINLDVPVEGDLDDPHFSIGRVILQFLMSLLKKIATAPFALLGALFGGGGGDDELSHVDFLVGASAIPEDQTASLDKLAKALSERPQLSLEVRGRADADSDAAALRRAKFASVAAERMTSDPKRYGGGLGYSNRLLEDLYVERFGKKELDALKQSHRVVAGELPGDHPQHKSGSKKTVIDERAVMTAVQDALIAAQPVDEAELLSLARARSQAVKQYLVGKGIEDARLYVLDPEPGKVEKDRIRIELGLTD